MAQLAGYVSEHSAYHHGEASLNGTIVGMAQDYTGSNNLNLLTPSGQFGTRLMGGKVRGPGGGGRRRGKFALSYVKARRTNSTLWCIVYGLLRCVLVQRFIMFFASNFFVFVLSF